MSDRLRLAGLVGVEAMAVALLHHLARVDPFGIEWADLGGWLSQAPAEAALGALLLVVALALAYWLLVSTIWYWMASHSGHPAAVGVAALLTLPVIRRLVGRAAALSVAVSSVAMPAQPVMAAWFDGAPVARVLVIDQQDPLAPRAVEQTGTNDVILPPHLRSGAIDEQPSPVSQAPPQSTSDDRLDPAATYSHRVVRGDHLWSISENHLQAVTGSSDLGEREIAPYWVRVIAANRDSIRSGNPDLIYPGELVILPPVEIP